MAGHNVGQGLSAPSGLPGTGWRRDENQKGLARLVSLRHEYPSEWYRFLHPAGAADTQSLTFALTAERFPFLSQGRHITLGTFEVFVQVEDAFAGTYKADTLNFVLAVGNSASTHTTVQPSDMLSLADWNGVRELDAQRLAQCRRSSGPQRDRG